MATLTRADISAAISLLLQDKLVDQFRRDLILTHLFAVKDGYGESLNWNPKFTGRTAGGAYAEGADMADGDFDSHDRARATLQWAAYRAGAKISGLAMAAAANRYAGAPGMGGDLFDEELEDAIDKIALDLGVDFYAGDETASPVELAGAARAVDSTLTPFAGLAVGTYPEWVGGENSIAATALSFDQLRTKLFRPVKDATGRLPDFVTTTGTVMDSIKSLFEDKAEVVNEIRIRGAMIDIKKAAGAEAVMLDGVPFIEDRNCTASTLHAWTASDVEIIQLPAKRPQSDPSRIVAAIKALTGMDVPISDVEARLRRGGVIIPTVEMLAQTGDAYKAMVKVYLQLKWRRRNSHSKLLLT